MRNIVLGTVLFLATLSWQRRSLALAEDDHGDDDQRSSELSGLSIIPYPVPVTKTIIVPKPIIIKTTKTVKQPVYIPVPVGSLGGYYGQQSNYGAYPSLGSASSGGFYYPGASSSGGLVSGGLPLSYGGYGYYPGYYPSFGAAAGYPQYPQQQASLYGKKKGFSSAAGWYYG